MSLDTKARLRVQDFQRFKDTDAVQDALTHLSYLTTEQFADLATQHKSGRKVVQKADNLIHKLQVKADKASL